MKKLFSALNTFKRIESPYGAGVCKGLASELGVAPWKVDSISCQWDFTSI